MFGLHRFSLRRIAAERPDRIAGHRRTAPEFETGGPSACEVVMNSSFDKDLYAVLGVSPDAPLAVIREARTRLLKRYHPDKGGDSETAADRAHWTSATAAVNAAWDVLKNPRTRAEYDARRAARAAEAGAGGPEAGNRPSGGPRRQHARGGTTGDSAKRTRTGGRRRGPSRAAGTDGRWTPPPPPRRPPERSATWGGVSAAGVVLLLLAAFYSEASFQRSRIAREFHEAHAERAGADRRRAAALLSVAEARAREAQRASREASSSFWAASWDLRKKQIALTSANVGVISRGEGLIFSGGAVIGGGGAAVAGAASWVFSKIPWDPFRTAADWAREVGAAAEAWAARMERLAEEARLNREQRLDTLKAAVAVAEELHAAARRDRAKASAAADLADGRLEHARGVLETARTVAERAVDRAADSAGDAGFHRTVANGVWVSAVLSAAWAGTRRRALPPPAAGT